MFVSPAAARHGRVQWKRRARRRTASFPPNHFRTADNRFNFNQQFDVKAGRRAELRASNADLCAAPYVDFTNRRSVCLFADFRFNLGIGLKAASPAVYAPQQQRQPKPLQAACTGLSGACRRDIYNFYLFEKQRQAKRSAVFNGQRTAIAALLPVLSDYALDDIFAFARRPFRPAARLFGAAQFVHTLHSSSRLGRYHLMCRVHSACLFRFLRKQTDVRFCVAEHRSVDHIDSRYVFISD